MLLLFDIDGTLLRGAADAHREALHDAITEVWGVPDPAAAPVEAAGRTDLEIAREILLLSGVNRDVDERFDAFREAAARAYVRRCPASLADTVADGIGPLLDGLGAGGDHTLGLVTGNLEPIARLKLRAAGIGGPFEGGPGGFGSDDEDRSMLPGVARRRAARAAGRDGAWPREDTVIIGDTPRDILCARADGVHVVGIATGPYAADALTDADAVVVHAAEIPAALTGLRP